MSENSAQPGWYDDPGNHGAWRWWDGSAWTAHTANKSAPLRHRSPAQHPAEQKSTPWALRAAIAISAVQVFDALMVWANSSQWVAYLHALRTALAAPNPSLTSAKLTIPISSWWYVASLVLLASEVVFLVWQFQATSVARELGYPTRHSPGWGVGSWFVPIVNLWIPCQALMDTLPLGHPKRTLVLRTWFSYLAANLCGVGAILSFYFSTGVGIGLALLTVSLSVLAGINGYRSVRVVSENHVQAAQSVGARPANAI